MRGLIVVGVLAAVGSTGCGDAQTKIADKPTEEMIAADQAHQKEVEVEEQGTPIKKGKKR
jgi:hypothetical protein